MAERPTTLFDAPAGDRPGSETYQPGTWLAEPDPDDGEDREAEAIPPPAARRFAQPDRRLLLHRLLEAERRLADRRAG
jgi:hypothetical protein